MKYGTIASNRMANRSQPHLHAKILLLALLWLVGCAPVAPPENLPAVPSPTAAVQVTAVQAETAMQPLPTGTIPQPSSTIDPSPTITQATRITEQTSTPTPLPAEHFITGISGHKQYFTLGCEAAAAKDWANFFGYDFNEFEFQYKFPLSDNPDLGFVGDVNAPWGQVPPYGYGVHAGPLADLLNAYAIPAKAYKNYTLDQVIAQLAADRPVIAWVIGNMVGGVPYEYTDQAGNKVTVAAYEHVVILTGYSEKNIRYMTNGKFYEAPKAVFLNSWGVLGNMVVVKGD